MSRIQTSSSEEGGASGLGYSFRRDSWYGSPTDHMRDSSAQGMSFNMAYVFPMWLPAMDYDKMAVNVTTAQPDSTMELGVYDTANGEPNALLASSVLDASVGGALVASFASALTLTGGWYWLAAKNTQTAGTAIAVTMVFGSNMPAMISQASSLGAGPNPVPNLARNHYRRETGVGGSLPDPFVPTQMGDGMPRLLIHTAA